MVSGPISKSLPQAELLSVAEATPTYTADRAYVAKWLVQRQYAADNTKAGFGAIRMNADPSGNAAYYLVVPYRSNLGVPGLTTMSSA